MATFQGNPFSGFFKRILQFGHAGNNGTPTALTNIQAGDGVATSMNASDDVFSVQPQNDDSVGSLLCKNSGGSNILAVDTTNSLVKVGASQVATNTQEKIFAMYDFSPVAGSHYMMVAQPGLTPSNATTAWVPVVAGTGTHPPTSQDLGSIQEYLIPSYWYVSSNITIDEVRIIAGCDNSSTLNFHLMSYSVVTGTGSTAGDLDNGVYNAASGTTDPSSLSPITVGDDRISIATLTIENADVDAGKIILAYVENVGGTDDVTAQLILKYHIR